MNHLAHEQSLYLCQHASNPVDWYPWSEEAFQKAREENKPLLVSIGYSACHWCHVMERECFENAAIARLMNEHFVCIKVDREERPDVDQIYMDAVQMMNQHGGWPLNVFCLPDGRPFAGGTYFPPDDRGHGIIPWPQLLMRIADAFRRRRSDLEENAEAIIGNMGAADRLFDSSSEGPGPAELLAAAEHICETHDDQHGGFGSAPKFPPSMTLGFLQSIRGTSAVEVDRPSLARRIDSVTRTTLEAIARGGIFDQIGGGFARYSVDKYWRIPHFEKMLYDNALLIDAFAREWRRHPNPLFRAVTVETLAWVEREMRHPDGGYIASIDADSDGEEGQFYVWTPDEIRSVLGKSNGDAFCSAYGITDDGNFERGTSNPTLQESNFDVRESFSEAREKLREVRSRRVAPVRDPKRLTSWNALLLRALAEAGFSFGSRSLIYRAGELADFLWSRAHIGNGKLHAVIYDEGSRHNGLLHDYAFFAEGLLTLGSYACVLSTDLQQQCLDRALMLIEHVVEHFSDGRSGYFVTGDDHEPLVHKKKDWFDNATPSGLSALLHCMSMLQIATEESRYHDLFYALSTRYRSIVQQAPAAVPHAMMAITEVAKGPAVLKIGQDTPMDPLWEAVRNRPWRRLMLLKSSQYQPGIQVCVGHSCQPPTEDPVAAAAYL